LTNTPAVSVLLDTLLAFQNGTAAAFPYGTLLKVLESSGEGQPFHNAFTWCDQQITTAVLHQTRATMEAQHGSRADSETGQDILGTIQRQAKRAVATMIKRDDGPDVARALTPKVSLGSVEQHDFAAYATAIAALAKSGYLDASQYAGIDEKLNLPPRAEAADAGPATDPAVIAENEEDDADEPI
jgi:phage gp29-like protein